MTLQEQQLCLFLLEQKLKAHMVLGNTLELSNGLKTLARFSSCIQIRSNRCIMSPDFVLKQKLDDNLKAAKNLLIHFADSLLEQEHYELARQAFFHAGDLEGMEKCFKKEKEHLSVGACSICYTNPVQLVFYPCKHGTSCKECYDKLKLLKCPICRETIESTTAFILQAAPSN